MIPPVDDKPFIRSIANSTHWNIIRLECWEDTGELSDGGKRIFRVRVVRPPEQNNLAWYFREDLVFRKLSVQGMPNVSIGKIL